MAVPNKISPTAAPSVAPATNRVAGVRAGMSGASRVDELPYSPWLGNADASPRFEDRRQDSGQFQDPRQRQREDLWALTPLMTRFAASFVANESTANDNPEETFAAMVARTDVARGIGVYEQNMMATSQETRQPGTLLNHFY